MSQNLQQLHMDFLEDLELGFGRSAKTVANYDHYLTTFFSQQEIQKVADIKMDTIRDFRRYLNDQKNVVMATQNYHFIAVRQFLKYLARRDIAALSPAKIQLAKLGERDIDVLYPEEVDVLLQAPGVSRELVKKERPLDIYDELVFLRDTAMLVVFFSTGMRISELVRLDRDDIQRETNELAVRGKGNKVRVVFLSDEALGAINNYETERSDMDPALFVRHNPAARKSAGEGGAADLRITPRSIQRLIKKYAVVAGLTKNITPHTLRHSFATDLLTNGADVRQVQQLLGHASITTTQVYTHLTDAHLREVHQKFHRKRKVNK